MSNYRYTEDQLQIELLKQSSETLTTSLGEIKHDLKSLTNYIIGLYGMIGVAALAVLTKMFISG